jgi:hypothetical protein
VTPTELRKNIYRVLDRVAETGNPETIERNGLVFRIICESPGKKLEKLIGKNHPKAYRGNSDEIITMDWSKEWKPGRI